MTQIIAHFRTKYKDFNEVFKGSVLAKKIGRTSDGKFFIPCIGDDGLVLMFIMSEKSFDYFHHGLGGCLCVPSDEYHLYFHYLIFHTIIAVGNEVAYCVTVDESRLMDYIHANK